MVEHWAAMWLEAVAVSHLNVVVAIRTPQYFLRDKKPGTDKQRVAVLAYYLTHFKSTPEFKKADIEKMNTEAEGAASIWTTHSIMRRRCRRTTCLPSVAGKSSSRRSPIG